MPYISHEKLIEDNKPEYYVALRKSQKNIESKKKNINFWLEFFLTIILKQSEMAVELLSNENIEKLLTKKQLTVWQHLENVVDATPMEIAKKTKVAQPTVRQAISKLMRLKRIERVGMGRSTRYRKIN